MIVEPTPTNPRSPWRRGVRLAGLVLPVVLLAAVVGAGVLGPRPEPAAPLGSTSPPVVAVPVDPSPATSVVEDGPPIPIGFGDLGTVAPGDLVQARLEGRAPEAVAVGGYLAVSPATDCAEAPGGPLGPWCEREGLLADGSFRVAADGAPSRPPHVHLVVPVGVRLPAAVLRGDGENRVLVVGRFAEASCGDAGGRCEDGFVVERFAWADGLRVGLTPLVADRLDTGTRRPNPFQLGIDVADLPLSAVLAWPDAIASIDPTAAGIVAAAGPSSEPVWYVRVLDGARGPSMERRIRWMLLAEKDLRILGSGRPAGTAGAGTSGTAGPGTADAAPG